MEELISYGFELIKVVKGEQNGYPNDVSVFHRKLSEFTYQEVRVDFKADKLSFDDILGTPIFKIWLGIKQVKNPNNLKTLWYV